MIVGLPKKPDFVAAFIFQDFQLLRVSTPSAISGVLIDLL
jgi:hypothetical protein